MHVFAKEIGRPLAVLVSLAQTHAPELAPHGIRVNEVAPGPTRTPLFESVLPPEDLDRYVDQMLKTIPLHLDRRARGNRACVRLPRVRSGVVRHRGDDRRKQRQAGDAVKLRRGSRHAEKKTLYYASDVHGSDFCWRKFLNAASFYGADALVMGGDLTGKVIVPIANADGTYRARFMGRTWEVASRDELDDLERAIRLNGFYPWIGSPEAVAECETNEEAQDRLFSDVVVAEIDQWARLADERLAGSSNEAWLIPGNDDPWCIDPLLRRSERIHFCDGEIVRCCGHEMVSLSYSNRTPWDSPRELDEADLYSTVRALIEQLADPSRAIFNLHVPPYASGLDTATELDESLRPSCRVDNPCQSPWAAPRSVN